MLSDLATMENVIKYGNFEALSRWNKLGISLSLIVGYDIFGDMSVESTQLNNYFECKVLMSHSLLELY